MKLRAPTLVTGRVTVQTPASPLASVRFRSSRMRSYRRLFAAVSGHLAGWHAPATPSHLFVRTLQILAQPEPVRLQKLSAHDSGIVELTLDRPEVKNAINWDLMGRLRGAIEKIEADATAKVVLVASSVPGVFCAGADLKVYTCSAW